jgi:hypothetical protein
MNRDNWRKFSQHPSINVTELIPDGVAYHSRYSDWSMFPAVCFHFVMNAGSSKIYLLWKSRWPTGLNLSVQGGMAADMLKL